MNIYLQTSRYSRERASQSFRLRASEFTCATRKKTKLHRNGKLSEPHETQLADVEARGVQDRPLAVAARPDRLGRRHVPVAPGGSVRGERANLKGLVLGCIEARVLLNFRQI